MVDDDVGDLRLTREAMGRSADDESLHFVHSGADALAYLQGTGEFKGRPRPDCVVLDLNMPGLDGFETLQAIQRDRRLRDIPVIVLTTSGSADDEKRALALGAKQFLTKPRDLDKYLDLVGAIGDAIVSKAKAEGGDSIEKEHH